jgi:osmotically-inducible protein OsmY
MNSDYQYLVGELQHALATDQRVNMLDIKVIVRHGRIYLIGQVPTEQRRKAVEGVVLELLPGVDVRNELTVLEIKTPSQPEIIHD